MRSLLTLLFLFFAAAVFSQPRGYQILSEKIDSILDTHAVDAMQLVIVNKDDILFQQNFGTVPGSAEPLKDDNLFIVASLSKSFTALSVMMLVEEGKLSLNDKLRDLAPEIPFTNKWEDTHPITLAHLMEHTTGWDKDHLPQFAIDREKMSLAEAVQFYPKSMVSRYAPGQFTSYTNDGPNIAGYIVEKISGMPFQDFVQQRILDPLNMKASTYFSNSDYIKKHLTYDLKTNPTYHLILDWPAAGMTTHATDMANYLRFFLNQGRMDGVQLLSPQSLKRMETPKTTLAAKAGMKEGGGLGLFTQYYKGEKVILHDGSLPGFGSLMAFLPERDIAFFYTCTTDDAFVYDDLFSVVLEALAGSQLNWAIQERTPATDISLAGYYRPRTVLYQITAFMDRIFSIHKIVEENGQLFFTELFGDTRYPLYSAGDQQWYYFNEDGFKFSIYATHDYDGHSVLMNGFSNGNLRKTTGFSVWSTIILTAICLFLILTLPVVLLIRLMIKLFGRKKTIEFNTTLQMGMMSLACLMVMVLMLTFWSMGVETSAESVAMIGQLANKGPASFSIYILSILFGVFALLAFLFTVLSFGKKMHRGLRVYGTLVGLALLIVAVYLWSYGFIGFQFWAY